MLYAQVIVKQRTNVQELTYALSAQIIPYIKVGSLVEVPLRQKSVAGVVVSFRRQIPANLKGRIKKIGSLAKEKGVFSAAQISVIHNLAEYYAAPLAEVAFHTLDWFTPSSTLRDEPSGSLRVVTSVEPDSNESSVEESSRVEKPTIPQPFRPVVITGVWSDRRQAYQQILAKTKGRVVIIFAQHLFADSFYHRFHHLNSPYVIYDIRRQSRKKIAVAMADPANKVFVGTLGEAFFPMRAGDTLIIDQPNHIGAKSQLRPFMTARRIGLIRAATENLQLVFGDTIASLDDLLLIKEKQFRLIAAHPTEQPLTIIDRRGQPELIAPNLLDDIKQSTDSGDRVLVVALARGLASALVCRECGNTFACRRCQRTTGVFGSTLRCLYCRAETELPIICPNCQSTDLKTIGEGVSAIKKYLADRLPGVSVAEVSSDQNLSNKAVQVTVATEKIFSFPDLKFNKIYVVSADRLLSGADLDGSWRLLGYLLEWQSQAKQITVQTFFPDSNVWTAAATGRLQSFFTTELTNRRQLKLPPYGAVINIRGSASSTKKLFDQAEKITTALLKILPTADISYPTVDDRSGSPRAQSRGSLYHGHFTLYLSALPSTSLKAKLASALPPAWHLDL